MVEYGRIHTDGSRSGGQPVGTRQKAHTMVLEVLAEWWRGPRSVTPQQLAVATTEALCRAIDQQEDLATALGETAAACADHLKTIAQLRAEIEALRQPTQSDAVQADIDAMKSILWVDTIIDDQEAITKAFARHRQYGYDQGYYDGQRDRQPTQDDMLRKALRNIQIEAEREKGSWVHLKRVIALNCKTALEQSK